MERYLIMEKNDVIKKMDLNEFLEKGFLQEVNRKFFHPLGLALEVNINEKGTVTSLGGIWDYRGAPEGLIFCCLSGGDAIEKAENVRNLLESKAKVRQHKYGFVIQPIEKEESNENNQEG